MYKRMVTQAGRNEKTAIFNLHRLLQRVLIVSFSCFCLRYTLHLANFGHSFPRRQLFNIIDRMVIQLSMLKIEKKMRSTSESSSSLQRRNSNALKNSSKVFL